jgi:RNA polymerase sigma factor (TIGR02999 family)
MPEDNAGPRSAGGPTDELMTQLYEQLRMLAHARMKDEPAGQTLQPTALVHEAYLRLAGQGWQNRGHFFASAAIAMRRILVERARSRGRLKRGGGQAKAALEMDSLTAQDSGAESLDLLALDDALMKLEQSDGRKAQVVTLRYFAGLSVEETAEALAISPATVKADWAFAKAWLHREMQQESTKPT